MNNQSFSRQSLELFLAYARNRSSVKLRNQLVQLNLGLVRKVAYRLSQQCAEPYEDLQQIGYLGLIRAIERFDPVQGYAFSSFAIPYIRGEMLHYLRDRSSMMKIPRRWQELYKKGLKIRKKIQTAEGIAPSDQQLAEILGVPIKEWYECQQAVQNRLMISLDIVTNQSLDYSITIAETLADPKEQRHQIIEEDRIQLQGAMNQLEAKTRATIEWIYFCDLSRKEVANRIGISPMTVTRHLKKGIAQLGSILEPQSA